MRVITKLEPIAPPIPRWKRVAAYARVSSGKDAMLHSLSAQISYYSDYIQRHGEWEYVGVYADDYAIIGLSGRNLDISRGLELGPIIFLPSFYYFI